MTEKMGRSDWSGSPAPIELTDGERVFMLTGQQNVNGYWRADVVRVTDAGRDKGRQPGVQVWLTPEIIDSLREVD